MTQHSLPVKVSVDNSNGYCRIVVDGEVDISNAQMFRELLEAIEPQDHMVIDLRGVPFMDSTGLNAIAQYGRRVKEEGAVLQLLIDRPVLRKVFDITGLSQHFPIVESETQIVVL